VLSFATPVLLLGGGGYQPANTARCWTLLTATAAGIDLRAESDRAVDNQAHNVNIPDHSFFNHYAPSYQLDVPARALVVDTHASMVANNDTLAKVMHTIAKMPKRNKHQ
jgi:hypothetical protein